MKLNRFILPVVMALVSTFGIIALAQKSNTNVQTPLMKHWKKIEQYASKQLPESALKEVEAILIEAKRENNSIDILKAMLYRIRFTVEKDPDAFIPQIIEFEKSAQQFDLSTDKAVVYALTAELYYSYYRSHQYVIDRRTDLAGFTPKDVNEWTRIHFVNKIVALSNRSLLEPERLQKTDALKYKAILEPGKDSRTIKPTLFDFLMYKRIEILSNFTNEKIASTTEVQMLDSEKRQNTHTTETIDISQHILNAYDSIIAFNRRQNNTPALVYAELERLKTKHPVRDDNFVSGLNALEQQYNDDEAVVEIWAEKAEIHLRKNNETPEKNKINYRKTAYDIAQNGIKKYPNYKRIGLLETIRNSILTKHLSAENNKTVKPAAKLSIKVTTQNISQVKLTVYKINVTALEYYEHELNQRYKKTLHSKHTKTYTQTVTMPATDNFDPVDTLIVIPTGDYGIYEYTVEEPGNTKTEGVKLGRFTVTDLAFFQRSGNSTELYVVDRVSGKPTTNATISIFEQKWKYSVYHLNPIQTLTASTEDKYLIPSSEKYNNYIAFFECGDDKFFTSEISTYRENGWTASNSSVMRVSLFTDRTIYRPGQTVYFKGIAYYSDKNRQEVAQAKRLKAELFNTNGENVRTQEVSTNDFGSFAGSFILPASGLNGAYRISVNNQSIDFWVEEYKRLTFEVKIDKPKEEVRFGEEVTVKGTVIAYAGHRVPHAGVKYRVVRRPHRLWWWHHEPEKIVAAGNVKSDNDGCFHITFIPKKETADTSPHHQNNDTFYTYHIYADVTDSKGETQQGEQSLSVGDKALFLSANVPSKINKSTPAPIDVTAQTLNGEVVPTTVDYRIVKLEDPDIYYEQTDSKTVWKETRIVLKGTMNTQNKLQFTLEKLESGAYKAVFTTTDSRGNKVQSESRFILYAHTDKQPPVKAYAWLTRSNTHLYPGEKAVIHFGTSAKNTFVLYELMQGTDVLETRWIKLNNEIKNIEIPFKESYGAGVTVLFTFVKDERFFSERVVISRKTEEKKLMPVLSVFRDKLRPGEKAEWTIHIPESANSKKTAELLIGMYDASLDAIHPHTWWFDPTYREQVKRSPGWYAGGLPGTDKSSENVTVPFGKHINVSSLYFDDFNWFGLNPYGYYEPMRLSRRVNFKTANEEAFASGIVMEEVMMEMSSDAAAPTIQTPAKEKSPLQIRANFNETAFFYPQLRTDAQGNVKVSFTTPESLTRWNIKMVAHTQDLHFGQNETHATTQKELMVQMNLPRFVRRSDKLTLTANITNLSEYELESKTRLEIIDAASEQILQTPILSNPATLRLQPGQTVSVQWELAPLTHTDLVVVKVVAETQQFSDGEQRYLPVLPDKTLVTESQTLILRAGQTRTFTFEGFIEKLKNVDTRSFTIEYAGNPTWYAVQALPSVALTDGKNAIDYLTGYYANTLGSYIAEATPKLMDTFERWKKAGGTREALLSNLEKNQELKNMLLDETPWVMAAKDETEQKRQIALLFDLNQTRNQAQAYMDKLLQLQLPSGGFAWFEKMPENRYITQQILLHWARLSKMTKSTTVPAIHTSSFTAALHYLDMQIAKDFVELKKRNKHYQTTRTIDNLQLFYLHTRSEYPYVPIHPSAQKAVNYYTNQSERYWTDWTLYGKAMMAIVAHRNGKTKLAGEMLTSIRENAMKTDELGMYWKNNKAGWWWYERPIATQTAIIEAFAEIRGASADVDEMKIWLLKQKQTQRWDTPISTLDAIYALLYYGSDWLSNNGGQAVIRLGSTTLQPSETETGTAYIKETIPVRTLAPEMGKITVQSRSSSGISWGAAYWQYYQDMNKMQSHGKEINISKQLFVEQVIKQSKTMTPIKRAKLKKGDKVITRLVVTTDRDLEFVALKDLRAACFEPVNPLSGTSWKEGVVYYQTTKDASTQFFFNYLPKGTYVFEYELWVNNSGVFNSGIATIQCHYAPEFVAHTGGETIKVEQ